MLWLAWLTQPTRNDFRLGRSDRLGILVYGLVEIFDGALGLVHLVLVPTNTAA